MYFCPYFGSCGGCQLQDKSYTEQIEYKRILVSQYIREPDEIIASPRIWHYRNKVDFTVGYPHKIGFFNIKKRLLNINRCLIAFEESTKIVSRFRRFMEENNIYGYSLEAGNGIKFLVLRKAVFTKQIMLSIVLHNKTSNIEKLRDFCKEIDVDSFYIGVNPWSSSRIEKELLNVGNKYIIERLLDNYYKIYPNTFFQTNSYTAEIILEKIAELLDLKGNEVVYDLYSGVGTFAIHLAKYSKKVVAVEISKESINTLKENILLNSAKNIEVIHSKVEDLPRIDGDVIVLDPPRGGIEKKFFYILIKNYPKKIIYVSCNPETQSRDLEYFYEIGYKLEYVVMIDQFPHTKHVESIVLLRRS